MTPRKPSWLEIAQGVVIGFLMAIGLSSVVLGFAWDNWRMAVAGMIMGLLALAAVK